uniref:Uncharacterized protein n=1 Tax=Magallana gigas TaxID=29159 RepID=K1QK52_MAGGI
MSKLFHKFQEITDEHFEKLGTNLKETLHNTHQHFEKETKKVRSKVNIEIDSVNYRLQDNKFWMWLIVIVVVALIVVLLYLCIFGMTRNKKQFLESGFQEDKMEKSVVIVSFSTANKQLHKSIADTVAGDYKCHELLLGGYNIRCINTDKQIIIFGAREFVWICIGRVQYEPGEGMLA